jgi:hypothetical protein
VEEAARAADNAIEIEDIEARVGFGTSGSVQSQRDTWWYWWTQEENLGPLMTPKRGSMERSVAILAIDVKIPYTVIDVLIGRGETHHRQA